MEKQLGIIKKLKITKQSLYRIHRNKTKNGANNKHNTEKIVNALGGIDNILNAVLGENDILNESKLDKIHQIITTPQLNKLKSNVKINVNQTNLEDKKKIPKIFHTFNPTNNYLNALFGFATGTKISNALQSRWIKIVLALSVITGIILNISCGDGHYIYLLYDIAVPCVVFFPCIIFWGLSVNKKCFRLIAHSFEFWLKSLYAFWLLILTIWYNFGAIYDKWDYPKLKIIHTSMVQTCVTFVIVCLSLLDGIYIKRNAKIAWALACAVCCTTLGVKLMVSQYAGGLDDSVIYVTENIAFSLITLQISAWKIISIFIWKQAGLTYFRSKDHYAVLIKETPVIVWKTTDQQIQSHKNDESKHDDIQIIFKEDKISHHPKLNEIKMKKIEKNKKTERSFSDSATNSISSTK